MAAQAALSVVVPVGPPPARRRPRRAARPACPGSGAGGAGGPGQGGAFGLGCIRARRDGQERGRAQCGHGEYASHGGVLLHMGAGAKIADARAHLAHSALTFSPAAVN